MSRTNMTWEEALAVGFFDCDYCGVQPGEWCKARKNWRGQERNELTRPWAVFLHGNRTWVIRAARWAGSTESRVSELESLLYALTEVDERWRWTSIDQIVEQLTRQLTFARQWRDRAIRDAYPD